MSFEIKEYEPRYQEEVEKLILPIQQVEFGVPVTREDQPDLMDIAGTFQTGSGNFWVAVRAGKVIGTVGVADIGHRQVALKKMFVHRDFRGRQFGISASLMETVKRWCQERGVDTIYLGTTSQMTAAHRFYEKHAFAEVQKGDLPPDFPIVHVDSKFYRCNLG